MKITKANIVLAIIILLTAVFMLSQVLQFSVLANSARSLILPFATVLYYFKAKDKSFYFTGFLLLFSLSELMGLWLHVMNGDYMFFIGNSLYILGYIFLILEILRSIRNSDNYKSFFTKHAVSITVMVLVDIYLIVLLGDIVRPHTNGLQYALAMLYNSVILIVLSVALLNFFCNYTKKSLIIFFASLCIVFSEIVQMAYFYLTDVNSLSIIYSILLVLAFYLYMKQAFIEHSMDKNLLAMQ